METELLPLHQPSSYRTIVRTVLQNTQDSGGCDGNDSDGRFGRGFVGSSFSLYPATVARASFQNVMFDFGHYVDILVLHFNDSCSRQVFE